MSQDGTPPGARDERNELEGDPVQSPMESSDASVAPPEAAPKTLLNQLPVLNYVTVPGAPTYRAIVTAFYQSKQEYVIALSPKEVWRYIDRERLYVDAEGPEDIEYHLGQLVEWGNLIRSHDTTEVSRIEDFYRKRYLFHLTSIGEAAHRAVIKVESTVGLSGSLQTNMLLKIRDALFDLLSEKERPRHDGLKIVRFLHDLFSAFESLTEEANRFIGELNQHIGEGSVVISQGEEEFSLYKQAVLTYISHFVQRLRAVSEEIATLIQAINSFDAGNLIVEASYHAELPPSPKDTKSNEALWRDPRASWSQEKLKKWYGVEQWFLGKSLPRESMTQALQSPIEGGEGEQTVPTVERLANVAVGAVVGLTRTLGRLNDRRIRPVDRAADFKKLAVWFACCPDDRSAHELFNSAFGLQTSRHFHLTTEDPEASNPKASYWESPPAQVPLRLRTRGNISRAGRASPAADHSSQKRWIAQAWKKRRRQLFSASQELMKKSPFTLSELKSLDESQFELLLKLLDDALSCPRQRDGSQKTRSIAGKILVTLEQPHETIKDPNRESPVRIETPKGVFMSRDYRITIDAIPSRDESP